MSIERPIPGAPPSDQQTYYGVEDICAAAFALCWLKEDSWSLPDEDTSGKRVDLEQESFWLRDCFLRVLQDAIESDPEPDSMGDSFDIYQSIELGREGTPEWTSLEWVFEGRDDQGAYCFALRVTGSDDSAIWLDGEAVQDKTAALAVVEKCRGALLAAHGKDAAYGRD